MADSTKSNAPLGWPAHKDLEALVHSAAHDLHTSSRSISALLEIFAEDHAAALPPEARRLIAEARALARRQHNLLEDIHRHARLYLAPLHPEPLPLAELIRASAARGAADLADALSLAPDLGCETGDKALCGRLLDALLDNAATYRSPARPLFIAVSRAGSQLVIADNGIGFSPAQAGPIFGPGKRLHRAEEIPGSGFGLADCAVIAARHGWGIRAEGAPDEGARLVVDFAGNHAENA